MSQPLDVFQALTTPTPKEARAWLRALAQSPYQYHIDDDPHEVIKSTTGERTFTDEQCASISFNLWLVTESLGDWGKVWKVYFAACRAHEEKGVQS